MNYHVKIATTHRILIYVWVFVLVLALLPITANPVKPVKELASAVFVFLLSLSLLAWPAKPGRDYDWQRMPVLALAGLWLLWSFVSVLFSEFKMAGIDEIRVHLTWFLMALFAARVFREPRHVNGLFLAVCCAVFISSIYALFQYLGLDPFPWATRDIEEYRGLPSTYANPNFAGHTLMLALILGGGLITLKRFRWVGLMMLLIGAHLYETHMRGAPLGLAAGGLLLFCAWLVGKHIKGGPSVKVLATLSAVLLIGCVGIMAILPLSKARTGFYFPTDGSLILRYNGYYGAARMTLDHPVFGTGPGNFSRKAIAYWTPYEQRWFADQQKRNMHVHNDLLETATETGFPGLFLHVIVLMALLVRSLSLAFGSDDPDRKRIGYTLAVFFAAFIVDGLVGFNLRVPVSGALFFLMAGALEGIMAPGPVSVGTESEGVAAKQQKKNGRSQRPAAAASTGPEAQPRIMSGLVLCIGAFACLVLSATVFLGEVYYQRGVGLRTFAENESNQLHRSQALQQAQDIVLQGRRLVFWDERYSDLLGHIAMRSGQGEAAIQYYARALETDPHHPHKASNLARAYLSHALQLARGDTAPDFNHMSSLLEAGLSYGKHGARYCSTSPHVLDVLWRLERARAVLAEEQGNNAAPHWQEVVRIITESRQYGLRDVPGAYRALGMAHVKLNQPAQALVPFNYALRETPEDEPTWSLFEQASADSGRLQPLLDALHRGYASFFPMTTEREPAFSVLMGRMVHAYGDMRDDVRVATRFVRHGITRAPHRSELWALFSGLAAQQRNVGLICREAAGYLREQEDSDPLPDFVRLTCAESGDGAALGRASNDVARSAMQVSGRAPARFFGGAADLLILALEPLSLEPQREAEIRANLATAYLEAGRWEDADTHFLYAIEHLPESGKGRLTSARARAMAGMERTADAMELATQAVQMAPNDPLVQLTYARQLRTAGRVDEAAFSYSSAINALPDESALKLQAQRELERLRARMPNEDFDQEP